MTAAAEVVRCVCPEPCSFCRLPVEERLRLTGGCTAPDRDVAGIYCGHPLPCPRHPGEAQVELPCPPGVKGGEHYDPAGQRGGRGPDGHPLCAYCGTAREEHLPSVDREPSEVVKRTLAPPSEREKAALRTVLGVRVAAARRELGLSQRAMARELQMSGSWVREMELGAQFAPPWLLVALSEATGWPVGTFYGFGAVPEAGGVS